MLRAKYVPIVIVLTAMASELVGPALCGVSRPDPMPCCQSDGDCGDSLGRPSCCLDAPGDTSRADAGVIHKGTLVAATAPLPGPSTATDERIRFAGASPEAPSDSGGPPPLFLLHAAFLC